MNFDEALELIAEQKIQHVKVLDFKDQRILTIDGSSPTEVQEQLRRNQNRLAAYGRVTFKCADETIFKSSWRDAAYWQVTVSNLPVQSATQHTNSYAPMGYISASEATLKAEFEALKQKIEYDKQINELKAQNKKGNGADDFIKYIPLLGLLIDIKPEKLQAMNSLGMVLSAANGNGSQQVHGMAGLKDSPELQLTKEEEEEADAIDDELAKLASKVELKNIRLFIQKLNEKPELIQALTNLADNFK